MCSSDLNEIGYMVVDMIDARASDGYVVAGTHGAGVFSTNITDTLMTGAYPVSEGNGLGVYPNPADQFTTIGTVPSGSASTLKIYDATGKLFLEKNIASTGTSLPTNDWPSGIYYLDMTAGESHFIKKLVVRH